MSPLDLLTPEELDRFRKIAYTEAELAVRRSALRIEEEDGAPTLRRPKVLKVTNGDLTDNGDGTVSLDTSGAAGGGTTWLDAVPSGNAPVASLDDEFDDASLTGWTAATISGTATWTEDKDVLSVLFGNQTAADLAAQLKVIGALSTGDYIEVALRMMSSAEGFTLAGLLFSDGTAGTSNAVYFCIQSNNFWFLHTGTLTNIATTVWIDNSTTSRVLPWAFLRLHYVSANTWRAEASPDGVSWTSFGNADNSFTMTPTHMGMAVTSWGGATVSRIASFEYFRTSVA